MERIPPVIHNQLVFTSATPWALCPLLHSSKLSISDLSDGRCLPTCHRQPMIPAISSCATAARTHDALPSSGSDCDPSAKRRRILEADREGKRSIMAKRIKKGSALLEYRTLLQAQACVRLIVAAARALHQGPLITSCSKALGFQGWTLVSFQS